MCNAIGLLRSQLTICWEYYWSSLPAKYVTVKGACILSTEKISLSNATLRGELGCGLLDLPLHGRSFVVLDLISNDRFQSTGFFDTGLVEISVSAVWGTSRCSLWREFKSIRKNWVMKHVFEDLCGTRTFDIIINIPTRYIPWILFSWQFISKVENMLTMSTQYFFRNVFLMTYLRSYSPILNIWFYL